MTWGIVAVAGGSIIGGLISGGATQDAANTSAAASNSAALLQKQANDNSIAAQKEGLDKTLALQKEQFDKGQANLQPWLTVGSGALDKLAGIYGISGKDSAGNPIGGSGATDPNATFYQSPDYQFRQAQGIKALDAGAAARGGLDSGATRKAEIAYGGNLASGEFNNYANRLAALAGVGQTAANGVNAAGASYATGAGAANTNYANQVSSLGTSYANNVGNIYTNNANNQASASLVRGNNYASGIATAAGGLGSFLNQNPNIFSSTPAYTGDGNGEF